MKNALYLLLAGFLLVSACDSNDDKPAPAEQTSFIANGITDVTMSQNGTAYLAVLVELKSNIQEPVQIAVKDLPANVTCTISPENGTPTFTAALTFKATNASKGDYPAKITLTSVSGVTKTYDFKVKITEPTSIMNRLVGKYRVSANQCDTVTRITIERSPSYTTRIIFKKLINNTDIYGQVDTVAKTINIPFQPVYSGAMYYDATATFTNNTITLNGLMHGSGAGMQCNTTLTKY